MAFRVSNMCICYRFWTIQLDHLCVFGTSAIVCVSFSQSEDLDSQGGRKNLGSWLPAVQPNCDPFVPHFYAQNGTSNVTVFGVMDCRR